jgi:protein SCO1/2
MSWRTAGASLVVCVVGGALLWCGTDGFRALTSEQARRVSIARNPRAVPVVALEDQNGTAFTLEAYVGEPLALEFMYTQCVSVCTMLSEEFRRIDRAERSRAAVGRERLDLVSISFDPRDTPTRLREYAAHYGADGRHWRFARVRDAHELARLLRAFDIVVIPDGRGDYQHNAAVYLLDARGRLGRVLDISADPGEVARAVASTRR